MGGIIIGMSLMIIWGMISFWYVKKHEREILEAIDREVREGLKELE